MSECSCWVKYPNPMHKGKNGKWKCVDDYECIQDLQTVETPIGLTAVRRKTHCRRKISMAEETKKTAGELIRRKDALAVFGDTHPMDYNTNAYRKQIEELQSQSLTEIAEEMLEDIKAEICDTRCKWPEKWDKSQGELCESEHCVNCPLNRI